MELLGLTIDEKLNFSRHIEKSGHNAQYRLHPLRRIRKYLSLEKIKMSLVELTLKLPWSVQLFTIDSNVLQK